MYREHGYQFVPGDGETVTVELGPIDPGTLLTPAIEMTHEGNPFVAFSIGGSDADTPRYANLQLDGPDGASIAVNGGSGTARFAIVTQAVGAGFSVLAGGAGFAEMFLVDHSGVTHVNGALRYNGVISPAPLAADANNYSPTGLATASIVYQDVSAIGVDLTGLAGGEANRSVTIVNMSQTNSLNLSHESAFSAAANRFNLPGGVDMTVPVFGAVTLIYQPTISRWYALSTNFVGAL